MIVSEKTLSKRRLVINENVMNYFREIISKESFGIETGGIIVGELKPLDNAIIITDISVPYENDSRGKFHFNRKPDGHQEYMDELWEKSGFKKMYLGEWHTHNQSKPFPSYIDVNNWKRIEQRNHVAPEMFFVIVGTKKSLFGMY